MSISTYEMQFNGGVLKWGFWLYVWEVTQDQKVHLYVGRTGDSSSAHASSPFNRIGQHLNFHKNAKGNSLAKRLGKVQINPTKSNFRMLALGPLFSEQETFEEHKLYRDQMATFEYELAQHLIAQGHSVLGTHHRGSEVQVDQLNEIKDEVMKFLSNEDS